MGKSDAMSRRADHGTGGGNNDNYTLLVRNFFTAHATCSLWIITERKNRISLGLRNANRTGKQRILSHGLRRPSEIQREVCPGIRMVGT